MVKVWINGTFDVLHIGHIKLLEFANSFGLVRVGLDSDNRISKMKGKLRPFNNLKDRTEFISCIKFVNSVVSFNTDSELLEEIKKYQPDIFVIGSDYKDKNIIGSEFSKQVIFFEKIKNKSTTEILNYGKTKNL